jgi:hypothetical protein
LFEFALGGNPQVSDHQDLGLVYGPQPDGTFRVRYRRPRWIEGVTYTLEGSSDLEDWFPIGGGVVTDEGDGWESIIFDDVGSVPGLDAGTGFIRLSVKEAE